jgi:hypothetical protein
MCELSCLIPALPLENLEYHDRREDFVKWTVVTLGDGELAVHLRKMVWTFRTLTDSLKLIELKSEGDGVASSEARCLNRRTQHLIPWQQP